MGYSQWPASGVSAVSSFIQSASPLLVAGSAQIPKKTIRIEALMCGGGGGGGNPGGGGFGGLFVIEIPNPGCLLYLDHVIGAGGLGGDSSTYAQRGGTTAVYCNGTLLAAVGGGGAGTSRTATDPVNGFPSMGKYGGCGGARGLGGRPPLGKIIWTPFDAIEPASTPQIFVPVVDFVNPVGLPYGSGGWGATRTPSATFPMPGGGGIFAQNQAVIDAYSAGYMGGGGGFNQDTVGTPRTGAPGGSLESVSVWGLTGFAGGIGGTSTGSTTNAGGGGGGGGMLGAGSNGGPSQNLAAYTYGQGGLGGGGGGGHWSLLGAGGKGGDGFIMYRFYIGR